MAELFHDDDADLAVVQARNVAVLGYGAQAAAQSLSLRDSGVDVRVGLPGGGPVWSDAESAGLRVLPPYEACEEADLIVLLVPASAQRDVFKEAVEPNLIAGDALLLGHGSSIRYGSLKPPEDVDVIMVAPQAPGARVRREFEEGRGVPALVAVDHDASGMAWDLALSYAKAIGSTRAAALATTFAEESETALFGERAVLGGVAALLRAGFATLVDTGYQPEVAYFGCLSELKWIVDSLYGGGAEPWSSDAGAMAAATAPKVIDASVRRRLDDALTAIREGTGVSMSSDSQVPGARAAAPPGNGESLLLERTAEELRQLMSWVRPHDDEGGLS